VDIVEVERIARAIERWGDSFLHRIYTSRELARYSGRYQELAARFAGKEAISKALGTGMIGVGWREMEILSDGRGKPQVHLYGRARERAQALGLDHFSISLSHTDNTAVAMVVASGRDETVERAGGHGIA
jgi:holo-[acyl-carrier protein] synthase